MVTKARLDPRLALGMCGLRPPPPPPEAAVSTLLSVSEWAYRYSGGNVWPVLI